MRRQSLSSLVLKGVALAMSITAVVLSGLGTTAPATVVTMLGIGLFFLALWALQVGG